MNVSFNKCAGVQRLVKVYRDEEELAVEIKGVPLPKIYKKGEKLNEVAQVVPFDSHGTLGKAIIIKE